MTTKKHGLSRSLYVTLVIGLLAGAHIARPCVTNTVVVSNQTNFDQTVVLGLCGTPNWRGAVRARSGRTISLDMKCSEGSISVTARSEGKGRAASFSGEFGYLERFDATDGIVVVSSLGLQFTPGNQPSLIVLALAKVFGPMRCVAG